MNNTAQRTTLELSINTAYIPNWGAWEGVRELLQNGADAHDQGHKLTVIRDSRSGVVKIRNVGTRITRESLLLGTTTKANDTMARGQFGEGYKLAFLALLRSGVEIEVRTGGELWTPILERSDTYGAEVLKIRIRPCKDQGYVEFQLKNLGKSDWDTIKSRVLFIGKEPVKSHRLGQDRLLTAEKHRGQLYARGLWVCNMPDNYSYGYDLADVELDRDRKMADPWSLRYAIAGVLTRAVQAKILAPKRILDLVQAGDGETQALEHYGSGDLSEALVEAFRAQYGDDVVPVSSMAESTDASVHSIKSVMVSKAVQNIFEETQGTFEKKKKTRRILPERYYGNLELSKAETTNLLWASKLVADIEESFSLANLAVVDFHGTGIIGSYSLENGVRVAKHVLLNRTQLIATIVHEVAHRYGTDGSLEHREAEERIFGEIIARGIQ